MNLLHERLQKLSENVLYQADDEPQAETAAWYAYNRSLPPHIPQPPTPPLSPKNPLQTY